VTRINYKDLEFITFINGKIIPLFVNVKTNTMSQVVMRCPLCGDSKKSRTKARGVYYKRTASYYCFNCATNMSGLHLLSHLSSEPIKDILEEFKIRRVEEFISKNNSSSQSSSSSWSDFDIMFGQEDIQTEDNKDGPLSPAAVPELFDLTKPELDYLAERKITSLPFFNSLHLKRILGQENDTPFIFIPWLVDGKLRDFQIHNYKKVPGYVKYQFNSGGNKPVYGLDRIDPAFKYIICFEGVFDSLFIKNGVALGGTALKDHQEKMIEDRFPSHRIVLAFDADQAGIAATKKYIKRDLTKYLYFLPNLRGAKDINKFVIDHPKNIDPRIICQDEKFVLMNLHTGIEALAILS